MARSSHQSMLKHETTSHPIFVVSIIQTRRVHHHWIRNIVRSPTDHWDQHGPVPHQPVFGVNLEMHRLLQAPPVVCQGQTSSQTCVVRQLELQAKHRHPQLLQQDIAMLPILLRHLQETLLWVPPPQDTRASRRTFVHHQMAAQPQLLGLQRTARILRI